MIRPELISVVEQRRQVYASYAKRNISVGPVLGVAKGPVHVVISGATEPEAEKRYGLRLTIDEAQTFAYVLAQAIAEAQCREGEEQ